MRALLLAALLAACAAGDKGMGNTGGGNTGGGSTGGGSAGGGAAQPVVVDTIDQAVAAKGKRALVRGTARREKLGDSIAVQELTVHCHDVRFPDDVIGKPVAAEGTLVVDSAPAATTSDSGEISQGVEGDTTRWVLRGCALKP